MTPPIYFFKSEVKFVILYDCAIDFGNGEHTEQRLHRRQHTDPGRCRTHPPASGNVHRKTWQRLQPGRRHLCAAQGDRGQLHRRVLRRIRQADPHQHRGQAGLHQGLRTRHSAQLRHQGHQPAEHRRKVRRQGFQEVRRTQRCGYQGGERPVREFLRGVVPRRREFLGPLRAWTACGQRQEGEGQ